MKHLPNINGPEDVRKLSAEELLELADELRQEIIAVVSRTGGHLASSLGVVELTVALHQVFDSPRDRILWDVSHQAYAHKLLTGRREAFRTLRQYGGLSGYCKRTESEHDHFGAGHASTSISAALGLAAARDLKGEDHCVVAVIGDGAMTGGMAFEGMNNAGSLKKNLLVILNDNTWSISKNVGSISKYLTTIITDEKFNRLRNEVFELVDRFKRRDRIRETIQHLEKSIKGLLVPGMLFEKLGFRYFGPIDGHDLPLLVKTLSDIKDLPGPLMLHVATVKGKGFTPSEEDANTFHGIGKFNKVTGKAAPSTIALPTYTDVFGKTMVELANKNDKVVAITAAMSSGTGLDSFACKLPDRFFDVGIAEGHAACFAAGLAAEGVRPYLTVYSTFMQRAYDQVVHDMALQDLPVVICMDRAGLVGNDGPTHHGAYDISYLSAVPNITIAAPRDGNELRAMLHHTAENSMQGVTAIRFPRDAVPIPMEDEVRAIDWGRWKWLTDPAGVVILAVGSMVNSALRAREELTEKGLTVALINARFVKPLDQEMLETVLKQARLVVTVEEGALPGGFGQAVAEYLLRNNFGGKLRSLGIPDRFITHGSREELLREIGLDSHSIAHTMAQFIEENRDLLASKKPTNGRLFQNLTFRRNGKNGKRNPDRNTSLTGASEK
ncbi:MAG: 1-deoxy-D-xylulose-5-phosphate synthase [Candidatus Zixiibacteriota bacterium]|nr:MAG: 1-deoxy-D-xylulose-5-phosphate synthase [candidate division Zixibacteria bacterium]